jgi:hypothetical protein
LAFGNTKSGVFVPEIKIGMAITEVEKVLGPPEKKFTFPDKTVYKYKDFTIEFKNDVVTDITFYAWLIFVKYFSAPSIIAGAIERQ